MTDTLLQQLGLQGCILETMLFRLHRRPMREFCFQNTVTDDQNIATDLSPFHLLRLLYNQEHAYGPSFRHASVPGKLLRYRGVFSLVKGTASQIC